MAGWTINFADTLNEPRARITVVALGFGSLAGLLVYGLGWAGLMALGYLPALGGTAPSLEGFTVFLNHPQFIGALGRTVGVGFLATFISLFLSFSVFAAFLHRPVFPVLLRPLGMVLSLPHGLMALMLLLLFAPMGMVVRLVWVVGGFGDQPPDFLFAPDPWGLGMLVCLVIKETAFLILMLLATQTPVQSRALLASARSMGYHPITAWLKVIAPLQYRKMRFPLYAVLAFSLMVVEIPLITNSFDAPTLSLLVLRFGQHPDLAMLIPAASGSIILLGVIAASILGWHVLEKLLAFPIRRWMVDGYRDVGRRLGAPIAVCYLVGLAVVVGGLGLITLHAVSFRWRFPDLLPERWLWNAPQTNIPHDVLVDALVQTVTIGLMSGFLSVTLVLLALMTLSQRAGAMLILYSYLPLLIPQITLMLGVQIGLLHLGGVGDVTSVIVCHLLFVLPYVAFSLHGSLRYFDRRYLILARSLGRTWQEQLWQVTIPLCLRPLLTAFAVGFAVSAAQYLPTLLIGQGRVETLMTLFLNVFAGGNLREIAQTGLLLAIVIALPFGVAQYLPDLLYRHRRGMRVVRGALAQ